MKSIKKYIEDGYISGKDLGRLYIYELRNAKKKGAPTVDMQKFKPLIEIFNKTASDQDYLDYMEYERIYLFLHRAQTYFNGYSQAFDNILFRLISLAFTIETFEQEYTRSYNKGLDKELYKTLDDEYLQGFDEKTGIHTTNMLEYLANGKTLFNATKRPLASMYGLLYIIEMIEKRYRIPGLKIIVGVGVENDYMEWVKSRVDEYNEIRGVVKGTIKRYGMFEIELPTDEAKKLFDEILPPLDLDQYQPSDKLKKYLYKHFKIDENFTQIEHLYAGWVAEYTITENFEGGRIS